MKSHLIHARFDLLTNAARREIREIARLDLPQVPAVGETINLNGNPFLVQERGWAASDDEHRDDDSPNSGYPLYAYVTVVKLGDYKV